MPREWGLAKMWQEKSGELNSSSASEREMRWMREDLEVSVPAVSNHKLTISSSLSYVIVMFYYI